MVSVLNQSSPSDLIGNIIAQGIQQNFPQNFERGMERGRLSQGIDRLKSLSKNENLSNIDMILELAKSSQDIPERAFSTLAPIISKLAEARAMQKVPTAADIGAQNTLPRVREGIERPEINQNLPSFLGEDNKFFPNNVGPKDEVGNLPQEATSGKIEKLLSPSEKYQQAKSLSKIRTDQGIPTTFEDAKQLIDRLEDDKKFHNDKVEDERNKRVVSQREYGEKAVVELKRIMPDANSEMESIFKKIGEDKASEGKSEAEIDRYLAKEAVKFKNEISNIKNDLSAPRSFNYLQRLFNGNHKDFEQASEDLRVKLKPLLDQGLYDTSRNILSGLGYYPEERESIINPLSDRAKSIINTIPKASTKYPEEIENYASYTPEPNQESYVNLKNGIKDLFKNDNSTSIVLARKLFEDKGYDWRSFKDAFNELLTEEELNLNEDQKNQVNFLDAPPLTNLGKILHGLGLKGR